jgi:hypothetical protein
MESAHAGVHGFIFKAIGLALTLFCTLVGFGWEMLSSFPAHSLIDKKLYDFCHAFKAFLDIRSMTLGILL